MDWVTPNGVNNILYKDMLQQYNLLIGGMIGSGKTTIINGMIYSALFRFPYGCSKAAQFILLDPKRVSLRKYSVLPHCLYYARGANEMLFALKAAEKLMMQRYNMADNAGLEEWVDDGDLYIFVDEFADLMLTDKKHYEPVLQRLGQLGRAAHVHLVLATQLPNRDVITKKIKGNMVSSVALHCREWIESKQVIGMSGAERLPLYGDCIYQTPSKTVHYTGLKRYSDEEIQKQIDWWTVQNPGEAEAIQRSFRASMAGLRAKAPDTSGTAFLLRQRLDREECERRTRYAGNISNGVWHVY